MYIVTGFVKLMLHFFCRNKPHFDGIAVESNGVWQIKHRRQFACIRFKPQKEKNHSRTNEQCCLFLGRACDAGYYSLGRQTACLKCPPGYYCENADEEPVVCETGYYSNGTLTACVECDAGYVCPEGSKAPRPEDGLCPLGYYCPNGRDFESCPPGELLLE